MSTLAVVMALSLIPAAAGAPGLDSGVAMGGRFLGGDASTCCIPKVGEGCADTKRSQPTYQRANMHAHATKSSALDAPRPVSNRARTTRWYET